MFEMALFIYKTSIFDINCEEKVIFIVNFYAVATGLSKTKNFCAILSASLISIAITPLCFAKQSFLWYTRVVRNIADTFDRERTIRMIPTKLFRSRCQTLFYVLKNYVRAKPYH